MANISKIKRDRMISFLDELKKAHSDDASIGAFNEIENFLNEKKFGLVWEEHTEQVDEMLELNIPVLCENPERRLCKDESLPWNFIIEGDNLQALYLLEKTHKGKVDCIYIDPPYNTGAKDWKYNNDYVDGNDVYRHSKWLSMMNVRLKIAAKILKPNGVLICAIDDNELSTLGLLLEEIFPEYKITPVTVVHNPSGTQGKNFSSNNEFLLFVYSPNVVSILPEERPDETADIRPFMNGAKGKSGNYLRATGALTFYPILVKDNKIIGFGDVCDSDFHPESRVINNNGIYYVFPIDKEHVERKWLFSRDTVESIQNELFVKYDAKTKLPSIYRKKNRINRKTVWIDKEFNAKEYGSILLKNILKREFSFPKSLYAVKEAIQCCVEDNQNAIILDFFAGSGTTLHAVNLMNAEDGGNRRCIMVTNNEVSVEEAKKLTQQGYKPGDPEWEALGIAKYVTWPRSVCSIEGKDINGYPLKGEYITLSGKKINMSDGFTANVKYFKCDWTPRKPEDYLLSNALCLHIKEMIELQTAQEVDGVKNVLILNRDDFNKHILDVEAFKKVENIWLNQNMVLSVEEMRLLAQKGFKYIPREYFGQELREAAE